MERMIHWVDKLVSNWSKAPRILLVEDDPLDGEMSVIALRRIGCDVRWARGQEEAIECLRSPEGTVDLAFLDMKLGEGGSGAVVLAAIKQILPDLPVVIVTGYPSGPELGRAMKLGYVGLVAKPLTQFNLAEVFRAHKLGTEGPEPGP